MKNYEEETDEIEEDEEEENFYTSYVYPVIGLFTAIVSYHLYHDIFLAIINGVVWPLSWGYWLITKSVNFTLIKNIFIQFL